MGKAQKKGPPKRAKVNLSLTMLRLLLLNRCGAGAFHKLDRREAICLVPVAFTAVRDLAVVCRVKRPAPTAIGVSIEVIKHVAYSF